MTTLGADSDSGTTRTTSTDEGTSDDTDGGSTDDTGSDSSGSSGTGTPICDGAIDLGDMLPVMELGDTVAEDNDHAPSCFPQCAADAAFAWTAPAAGTYTIDTQGSLYDTGLYVLDGCGEGKGPELACNDDAFGVQSGVFVDLSAGQTITIIVDGYGLEEGPFQLNIVAGMAYDCLDWSDCAAGEYCDEGTCWAVGGGSGSGGSGGWATGGWGTGGSSDGGWGITSGGLGSASSDGGWGVTTGGWGGSDSGGWSGGVTTVFGSGSSGWGTGGWGGSTETDWGSMTTFAGSDSGGWGGTSGGWGGSSGGWGSDSGGSGGDDVCDLWGLGAD